MHIPCFPLQVDNLKLLHNDLVKQLDSLKAASEPIKEEVDKLRELGNIISAEEKEINKLMQGSKQLKEKVTISLMPYISVLNDKQLLLSGSTFRWMHVFLF